MVCLTYQQILRLGLLTIEVLMHSITLAAFMTSEATCIQMNGQSEDTLCFDLLDVFSVLVRIITEALEDKMALVCILNLRNMNGNARFVYMEQQMNYELQMLRSFKHFVQLLGNHFLE